MANKPHSQSCCAIGFAGVPDVSGSVPLKNSPECFVDNVDLPWPFGRPSLASRIERRAMFQ